MKLQNGKAVLDMSDYEYILTSDGELHHHGIKGQKWGVRRYQNADGTLTDAGKRRVSNREMRAYQEQVRDEVYRKTNERYDKDLSTMREEADREYREYVEKHGLKEEDEDPDAFWEDYEKRPEVYDKATRIYDKVNDREYEINMQAGKEVADRMVARFGQQRVDKFKRSEQTKTCVVVGTAAAAVAIVTLPMYVAALPIIAGVAIVGGIANKKAKKQESDRSNQDSQ